MAKKKIIFVDVPAKQLHKRRKIMVNKAYSADSIFTEVVPKQGLEVSTPCSDIEKASEEIAKSESNVSNEAADGACYDLWSTLSKIAELPAEVRNELYGFVDMTCLFKSFGWSEVVDIYNQFVESLLIGPYDIVENEGKAGLVLSKNNKSFSVLTASRAVQVWPTHQVKKIGHCDEFGALLESYLNPSKES